MPEHRIDTRRAAEDDYMAAIAKLHALQAPAPMTHYDRDVFLPAYERAMTHLRNTIRDINTKHKKARLIFIDIGDTVIDCNGQLIFPNQWKHRLSKEKKHAKSNNEILVTALTGTYYHYSGILNSTIPDRNDNAPFQPWIENILSNLEEFVDPELIFAMGGLSKDEHFVEVLHQGVNHPVYTRYAAHVVNDFLSKLPAFWQWSSSFFTANEEDYKLAQAINIDAYFIPQDPLGRMQAIHGQKTAPLSSDTTVLNSTLRHLGFYSLENRDTTSATDDRRSKTPTPTGR